MSKITDWLGYEVTDTITGLKGTVTSVVTTYSGMEQLDVQPKGTGKEIPQGYYLDPHRLTKGKQKVKPIAAPALTCSMGDEVEDVVTGFKGKVAEIIVYLNGCIKYNVQGKVDLTKKADDTGAYIYLAQERLKVIKAAKPAEAPKKKTTGGPIRKSIPLR